MTVRRPAFINLDLTSLIDQPITLHVQNISGHTVKEIQLGKEHRKSNFFLPLSFTGDYPFTYHVVGKMADGTSVFINGRERLAVVPSVSIRPVPLFLSNKGLCFLFWVVLTFRLRLMYLCVQKAPIAVFLGPIALDTSNTDYLIHFKDQYPSW